MKEKKISVIEMPLDFGASRHGSDMGPSAIRLAGLGNKLEDLGYDIVKYDCPIQINPKEYEDFGNPKAKFQKKLSKLWIAMCSLWFWVEIIPLPLVQ